MGRFDVWPTPSTLGRLLRFGALGAAGFGLNIAVTAVLTEMFGAPEELAFAISLAVVFVFSFLTSRYVIFAGAATGDPRKQLVKFAISSATFRGAEYLGFLLLHTAIGLNYLVAIPAVLGVSFLTKFVAYSNVVFKPDGEAP
jgi:putative flippase GtrA